VDVRRQLAVIRKWFPLLVVSLLLAAAAAFAASSLTPKSYEARATLIVGQSLSAVNPDYNQLLVSQRLSTTYATVATKRPILDKVIEKLGLGVSADDLAKRVRADAPLDSTLLTLTAQDSDPTRAAAIANALADQLIASLAAIQNGQAAFQASTDAELKATEQQIEATQSRVEALSGLLDRSAAQEAELQTLEGRLASLRSTYATLLSFSSGNAASLLSVVEPAVAPTAPVSPRPLLNTLVAGLVGLLIAAGVISLVEYFDDTIKDADSVKEVANLNTLGTIARMKGDRRQGETSRLATVLHPRSSVAEAYRTLRANVEFASVDAPIRALLVTSSVPREGKTVTAANLAVVFAQAGRRVLLVDADLRNPGIHLLFDLPNAHGLTSLLYRDDVSLETVTQATEQANLLILTTGRVPSNPAELLGSQRMRTVFQRLLAGGDLVIFDSPPLQSVTDAAILSSFVGGTVFVIDAGYSRRRAVRLGREALARAGANVLGAVLNRVPAVRHADGVGYGEYDLTATRIDLRDPDPLG
jgi:capsular exopolysaccharide synthesis family protein